MKLFVSLLSLFLFTTFVSGQKAEKFKPSKVLTINVVDVVDFKKVECHDAFDYYFEKGQKAHVKFETHENMQNLIQAEVNQETLSFIFLDKPKVFKKLKITIYYTDSFNQLSVKNDAKIYAVERIKLSKLTILANDKSRLFINGDIENFELNMDNRSKGEFNVKSSNLKVITSQSASLIAMFTSKYSQFDAYQISSMTVEGESEESKIRTSNGASFLGKKFTVNSTELFSDLNSTIGIFSNDDIKINATGDSKVYIYGSPNIKIIKFNDNSTLFKKSKI